MGRPLTIDEINQRKPEHSLLTAVSFSESRGKNGMRFVNTLCDCGATKEIRICEIIAGHTLSCGCLRRKLTAERRQKCEGNIREISGAYRNMMERCYNPKNKSYSRYGGRGVRVCEEWRNSYESFLAWAKANGWEKGLELDKDIRGDGMLYGPDTCAFVTPEENLSARRPRGKDPNSRRSRAALTRSARKESK